MADLISEFDLWRQGYGGATVEVRVAGTVTLAALFFDVALTQPAPNPQTLLIYNDADGNQYGKFERSLYTTSNYVLRINSTDESGVHQLGISSLAGQSANDAQAKPRTSSYMRPIGDLLANQIFAADFGALGSTAATNTATISLAIGQASANGGGRVILPAGEVLFTSLTLPQGVVLVGQGRDATVLKSQINGRSITLGGENCGLQDLTLDGVSLIAQSIGVYGDRAREVVFRNALIKRFETGLHLRGGTKNRWSDLSLDNCGIGAKLHGDLNVPAGNTGGPLEGTLWSGGVVSTCLTAGIEFSYEDAPVRSNTVKGVYFDTNAGNAVHVNGAQFTRFESCTWSGCIKDILVEDDDKATTTNDAKVVACTFAGGMISGGDVRLEDTLEDVVFDTVRFAGAAINLVSPSFAPLLMDCTLDAAVSITGDATRLSQFHRTEYGNVAGRTTDASPTKAWSSGPLDPGSLIHIEAVVLGIQRNGTGRAVYRRHAKFARAGSTLAYDAQTSNFTLGHIITGQTSGAKALIVADADVGATGTLTLREIAGAFIDNELITDDLTGSATVNGLLVAGAIAQLGSTEAIPTDFEDVGGWDMSIAATVQEIEIRVTGEAAKTIDWTVEARVVRT